MEEKGMRSGAYVVMEALEREGVDTIFGYPGGVVLPLYDEMLNWPQIKHVLVRHEQGGGHMAEGYAKATGKVGVCLATSGPGATNLVTPLADAMMDSVPLVAITGNVNSWAIGKDAFQEVDIQGVTIPITKHNYLVTDVDELPRVLMEAFYLARTGRKGPVLVDIPKDVFQAMTSEAFPEKIERRGYSVPGAPSLEQVEEAARLIGESQKPVMIAGAGALWSGAFDALLEFAEKTNIPVINSLHGLGVFPRDHDLSLGMMGMHGEATGTLAVQECDLLIGLGMRFDDRLTGATKSFAPNAKIVHFEIDPSEVNKTMATVAPVQGDLREGLEMLNKIVAPRPRSAWNERVEAWKAEFPLIVPEGRFFARTAIKALNDHTGGNAVVATDVGSAPDVGGAVLQVQEAVQLDLVGGIGNDGLRASGGDRGEGGASGRGGLVRVRGRRLPDDVTGASGGGGVRLQREDHAGEQRVPGHGAPVAGAFLRQPVLVGGDGGAGLREDRGGVPDEVRAVRDGGGDGRENGGGAGARGSGPLRVRGGDGGERVPDGAGGRQQLVGDDGPGPFGHGAGGGGRGGGVRRVLPSPTPEKGGARKEADVQTVLDLLKKKPQPVRDFEAVKR